jgi:hypothetical protein
MGNANVEVVPVAPTLPEGGTNSVATRVGTSGPCIVQLELWMSGLRVA